MNINYKILLENEIKKVAELSIKPKLLLHACCAPCSSAVTEYLFEHFDITLYFYNPNISPKSEYILRADELKRLSKEMFNDQVKVVIAEYENNLFEDAAKGFETAPEGGARCEKCFYLRLKNSVEYAKNNGFDYVTTTLTVSPHKNPALINKIGGSIADSYGIKYLYSDFKKNDGYKRSCQLSREFNLYRQNYCGCRYSKKEEEE